MGGTVSDDGVGDGKRGPIAVCDKKSGGKITSLKVVGRVESDGGCCPGGLGVGGEGLIIYLTTSPQSEAKGCACSMSLMY